ncbi:MAG: M48 family metallopeptidase [Anaerolineales bacterium]|nr:M48 family metallopeptidase [Anaerolineales bacterium]
MTIIDSGRQEKAQEYAKINRRLWLVSTLLGGLYALVWLISGWSTGLQSWLIAQSTLFANPWFLLPAYLLVFGGIYSLITLPLDYYTGYVLPKRFDQSNQRFKEWIIDQLKGLAISVPIALLMVELLYLALRSLPHTWWLWATGGLVLFNVLVANLAPILIMPIFNKFVPLEEEHAGLADRLIKLADKAKTKVKGVFKYDMSKRTKAANAGLTGIGNTRRIVLGDTLIAEFTPDEIETILAHELGHHVHNDIPLLMTIGALLNLVGMYLASLGLDWAATTFGFNGPADIAGLPAFMLVIGLFSLVLMPLSGAFSRWRESMADAYALEVTGNAKAFETALIRLANQNLGEINPERWVVWLFHSHPPLGERIAKAKNWK